MTKRGGGSDSAVVSGGESQVPVAGQSEPDARPAAIPAADPEPEGIPWHRLVFGRMTDELVLVDILQGIGKDGKPVPKERVLEHLQASIEAERWMIRKHGRKLAAKLYGMLEGVTSDVKTVDFVMTFDYATYYRQLIDKEASDARKATSPTQADKEA